MLDITRVRRKTLKEEKEKIKIRKIKTKPINIFLLLLFCIEKFIFCQKTYFENLVYIVTSVLQFFRGAGYQKCSNKIPTLTQICIGLADAVLRPKMLGNA